MKKTPVAWRNLTHRPVALAGALAATAFAVLIMFMQLGFLTGLYDSQTALARRLNGDLVIMSVACHNLIVDETFPRARLFSAARVPGVRSADAMYVEAGAANITNPQSRIQNPLRVLAYDVSADLMDVPEVRQNRAALTLLGSALYDRGSRRFVGSFPQETPTELASRRIRVVGNFELGADYYYDGNLITNSETFFATFPRRTRDRVAYGIVRVDEGRDPVEVRAALATTLPADVQVLTRDELVDREIRFWRRATPVGYVFSLGLVVGFIIGVAICYQILFNEVNAQIAQFAMLRAIGYEDAYVTRIVVAQSLLLGALGYAIGLILTSVLYSSLTEMTGIITRTTPARALLVFVLTLIMSVVAGNLAKRRALTADPAELY